MQQCSLRVYIWPLAPAKATFGFQSNQNDPDDPKHWLFWLITIGKAVKGMCAFSLQHRGNVSVSLK